MRREDLEHVIRAAATIAGVRDLLVIGSQAILGTYPEWELPSAATMSVEADLAVDSILAGVELAADETALADRIDGAIGEGSMFHQTYGYYAQGVETVTAVLPEGWRDRLVPVICEAAQPKVVGWCLDRHDLRVSKAAAGRPKDRAFCRALADAALVERATCTARVASLPSPYSERAETTVRLSFPT